MSNFKAGDVVLNKTTGAVHFYLSDKEFVHIICPTGEKDTWEVGVYKSRYKPSDDHTERELIFNLPEGVAKYLGYSKTEPMRD